MFSIPAPLSVHNEAARKFVVWKQVLSLERRMNSYRGDTCVCYILFRVISCSSNTTFPFSKVSTRAFQMSILI